MARTLHDLFRKRQEGGSNGGICRLKLSEVRKRKSEMERWMGPMLIKKPKKNALAIFIESSDDEEGGESEAAENQSRVVQFSPQVSNTNSFVRGFAGISPAGAIEIDGDDDRMQEVVKAARPDIAISDGALGDDDLGERQCQAVTLKGKQCRNGQVLGTNYCALHPQDEHTDVQEEEPETPSSDIPSCEGSSASESEEGESESDSEESNAKKKKKPKALPLGLDRVFVGNQGERRCLSITQRGNLCAHVAIDGTIYCNHHQSMHNRNPMSSPDVEEESESESDTEDAEVCPIKDKHFNGKERERRRCRATTLRGRQCAHCAVNSTLYCNRHVSFGGSKGGTPESKASATASIALLEAAVMAGVDTSEQPLDYDTSDSEASDSDNASPKEEDDTAERSYNHNEFLEMWKACEEYCGEMTEEIESTRRVRGANSKISVEDSDGQLKAQYGRLLPRAMKVRIVTLILCTCFGIEVMQNFSRSHLSFLLIIQRLLDKILCVEREDVFLDIGHGIGNTCLQAAFTVGCEARGIEVVYGRNSVAEVFRDNLMAQNEESVKKRITGKVHLRHGRLEDPDHQEFLTKNVTRAYVNNFNGVFAERSSKVTQKWFLDNYVAGLFALMRPGAVLVSLHPLNLGPTKTEANRTRKKQGLTESEDASFYEVDKILLGKACDTVKWNQFSGNQKNIYVYKYTRVNQSTADGAAVFLCCNPACNFARDDVATPATSQNEEDRTVINHCECRVTTKNLRRQSRKVYTDC
jgi:SAM-dependent methyltransferase